jgi:hypothetical protein
MKNLLTDEEPGYRQFLKSRPMPGRVIFGKLAGSRCHNTHHLLSDRDYAGVYIVPTRDVVALNYDTAELDSVCHDDKKRDKGKYPDHAFYEVLKFSKLLVKGNPTIIEMLFTEKNAEWSSEWEELRSIKSQFLTQQVVKHYLGFADGQMSHLRRSYEAKKSSENFAYHIFRLLGDASRIAQGGDPVIWKDNEERAFLMAIRRYEYDFPAIEAMVDERVAAIEELKPWKLPEACDETFLNQWIVSLRKSNW